MKCALCNLEYNEDEINFHHLIPKSFHSNKKIAKLFNKEYLNTYGVYLCKACHNKLHSCITEREMAVNLNTIEKIKENEDIKNWIIWKQKHPNFTSNYNRMTLKKRGKN